MTSTAVINQRNWSDIQINNESYMICIENEKDIWKVLLTNLIDLWVEILTTDAILKKVKDLNPLLDVDAFDYKKVLMTPLQHMPKYVVEASTNQIKLHIPIEGGLLKFSLNFTKADPQEFCENITKPLCLTSAELLRQQKDLFDIIEKKDAEIAEYKAEGAALIRKNIATKAFNKSHFLKQWNKLKASDCNRAFQEITSLCTVVDSPKSAIKEEQSSIHSKSDNRLKTDTFLKYS